MITFDAELSEKRKREGMALAAERRHIALNYARMIACDYSLKVGAVTADDVYTRLSPDFRVSLGNAAGSIFRGKEWKWTGDWVKSLRVSNHSRMIMVWRYIG